MKIVVQPSSGQESEVLTGVSAVYIDEGNLEVLNEDGRVIANYAAGGWQSWKKVSHVK